MSEAENRNLAGFDFDDAEPDRGGRAGGLRAEPDPADPGQRLQGHGRPALRRRRREQDDDQGAAARRASPTCSTSAPSLRGGVGLFSYDYFFENINQAGLLAGDARPDDQRQRHHLHGREPDEPDSERSAHPAGGQRARACRASSGQNLGTRVPGRIARRRTTRAGRPSLQHDFAARVGDVVHLRRIARARTCRCAHDHQRHPDRSTSRRRAAATSPTRRS